MDDGSSVPLWGLLGLLLLLWLNGIFYGFAAAVRNISQNELERHAAEGNKKAVLLKKLLDQPMQYINAIPLLVAAAGICAGMGVIPWASRVFRPYINHWTAAALAVIFCMIILASLGILAFRRTGTYYPERFAYRYVKIVHFAVTMLYPLTVLVTWIADAACVPFGVHLDQKEEAMTEEEIISIVDEAHEQGVIEENEAEMIQNIISFNETTAGEIMTHRKNVVAFSNGVLLKEMIDTMMEEDNSRYPVYGEDMDDILGVVHYRDAMEFMMKNSWARFKPLRELPGLIRQTAFIPETRSIGNLFRAMQAKKLHMAVVVDEYGQTAGIVTMEDILEEIVGDIQDEYDDDEISIRTQTDNSVIIDGLTPIEDVEDELKVDFGDLDFETLNGYLTSLLGHIPTEEDLDRELTANGYRFRILSLGSRTIGRVRAEKIKEKEIKGEENACQDIQNLRT